MNLQADNRTIVETGGFETEQIPFKRGLRQSAPLSPTFYSFIMHGLHLELSEKEFLSYIFSLPTRASSSKKAL